MSAMSTPDVSRYADMFAAMGAEPRLQIMRLLLKAHPEGLLFAGWYVADNPSIGTME